MTRGVLLAAVVLIAACAPGSAATSTPTASPTAPVSTASQTAAAASAPPTSSAPPTATLSGGGIGAVQGDLGSIIWNGLTSDTPWVVNPNGPAVNTGTPLAISADGVAPDRWAASWARVSGNQAGKPQDGGSGQGGGPIKVSAPTAAGTWGLRFEAWFGPYNSATWYWRVEVSS